jgi:GNAT superfamily N-acetyltransferase
MYNTSPQSRAHLLFDPCELTYDLGEEHPFQSCRLVALLDLLESSGLWQKGNEEVKLPFRAATTEELALIHTPEYIAAVQQLSTPLPTTASKNACEERERLATTFFEAINALLPPLILTFGPDVIVSQHGCDSHAWDPLTHLELTLRSILAQTKLVHQLAHDYCQGRWVALGGGGYDLYRVVPRAWSMVRAVMSEQELPKHLPEEWVRRWRPEWQALKEKEEAEQQALGKAVTPTSFPTTFQDQREEFPAQPREWSISRTNQRTVALARQLLLPPTVRQAFPYARYPSPMSSMVDLLHVRGSATPSRSKTVETAKGPLLMRDFCPLSLVERLKVESGMCAFARVPEREHQLLLTVAKSPDCALTLAHTPTGEIVGQVTLVPGEEWFKDLVDAYEVALEVSSHWRGLGIAQALLAYALEFETLEDVILFAMGLSWHWDMEGLGMSVHRYRELISQLFASQGFVEYQTTEPDINMEPGNILLARIGKRVDQQSVNRFMNRLLGSSSIIR